MNEADKNIIENDVSLVKSFELENGERYVRFQLQIDKSSDKINSYSNVREPEYINKTFFAKELIIGDLSLYEYSTTDYTRYIIQNIKGGAEQLVYKPYRPATTEIIYNNDYKKQIPKFINCKSTDLGFLQTLKHNQKDLINIILKNNICVDTNYKIKERKIIKGDINLNFNVRGNYTTLSMNQDNEFLFEFEPKFTFGVGIELEYIFPVNNKKWAVIVEPSYSRFTSTSSLQMFNFVGATNSQFIVDNVLIEVNNLDIAIGVRHYLINKGNNKMFINLSHITNIPVGDSFIQRRLFSGYKLNQINYTNFSIGFGSKIYEKFIVELRYHRFGNKVTSNLVNTQNNNVLSFIMGYNLF